MELKRISGIYNDDTDVLLIVPYGIETIFSLASITVPSLLIVPYGIETTTNEDFINWFFLPFNRTLWNWNSLSSFPQSPGWPLLIVPYGIETIIYIIKYSWHILLIVPYGIETYLAPFVGIVRYGLLIVPYGIETVTADLTKFVWASFNRTLWNWNEGLTLSNAREARLLIVPYGIETRLARMIEAFEKHF